MASVVLGLPTIAVAQLAWVLVRSRPPIDQDGTFSDFLTFGLETMVPLVVWLFWARREWRRVAPDPAPAACPACGATCKDVHAHVADEHGHQAKRILNRLERAEGRAR